MEQLPNDFSPGGRKRGEGRRWSKKCKCVFTSLKKTKRNGKKESEGAFSHYSQLPAMVVTKGEKKRHPAWGLPPIHCKRNEKRKIASWICDTLSEK